MIVKRHKQIVLPLVIAVALLLLANFPSTALAHVKWFSNFSFVNRPLTLSQAMTPVYLGLVMLSTLVISGMVLIDRQLNQLKWYTQINDWLSAQKENSAPVMRAAMAAVLLISWASGSVLSPELTSETPLLIWLQFVIAILLIFKYSTPAAGLALLALYLLTGLEFGFFHLIDYTHYAGIGFYLFVSNHKNGRLRELGLPALYATIGFSLMWLGYEKLVYPSWALFLLAENPQLSLGLPPEFFLQSAAFVEIVLGYLLIIGLLERPLAAIITLVFFSTTLIFGKIEIIGHTPIHAALIIFLFSGAGTIYKPPIAIHTKTLWRTLFAAVNFIILTLIVGALYTSIAQWQYEAAISNDSTVPADIIDLSDETVIPQFATVEVIPELDNRYNLHVTLDNWQFTPELTGGPTFPNAGHGHISLNGQEVGHLYGEWFYLGQLLPGQYELTITLHGNDHSLFVVGDKPLAHQLTFKVPASADNTP